MTAQDTELATKLSVAFVTHDSAGVLGKALAALPAGVPVIVVDNASTDGSAELAWRHGAKVLKNDANLGFGTACNQAAACVETPLILFLNPDAAPEAGAIDALCAAAAAHPEAAAFGPLLCGEEGADMPRAATLLDRDQPVYLTAIPDTPVPVGFLSGAALLVRTEVFRQIGGFDEEIFLYLEDDDLCFRLRRAGWSLLLVPSARVRHDQGDPSRRTPAGLRFRNRHTMASTVYLAAKHGVDFDLPRLRRKAWFRLILAALRLDMTRVHTNIGRLQGLGSWPFPRGGPDEGGQRGLAN